MVKDNRVVGTHLAQKEDPTGVNPKDRIGAKKIDLTVVPPIGLAETAFAMMNGMFKYGEFNWRVEPVLARTYVAAAMRHLLDWLDGEELAPDSYAHHLAHCASCCLILMDAQAQGKLRDDRPLQNSSAMNTAETFKELEARLQNWLRENTKSIETDSSSEAYKKG